MVAETVSIHQNPRTLPVLRTSFFETPLALLRQPTHKEFDGGPKLLVPGLFAPGFSLGTLKRDLRETGLKGVRVLTNVMNITGRSVDDAVKYQLDVVDDRRIAAAKVHLFVLQKGLHGSPTPEGKVEVLRNYLSFDDSELATSIIKHLLKKQYIPKLHELVGGLPTPTLSYTNRELVDRGKTLLRRAVTPTLSLNPITHATESAKKASELLDLSGAVFGKAFGAVTGIETRTPAALVREFWVGKDPEERLSAKLKPYREQLEKFLADKCKPEAIPIVIDSVFRVLAPRAAIVGHSMGGFVGTVAAITDRDSIQSVMALGSPLAGIGDIPPAFRFEKLGPERQARFERAIRYLIPAVADMSVGSSAVETIQNGPIPPGITIMSIFAEEDGFVPPESALLPEERALNLHNWKIDPRNVPLTEMAEGALRTLWRSTEGVIQDSENGGLRGFIKGLRGHINHVVQGDHLWKIDGGQLTERIYESFSGADKVIRQIDPSNSSSHIENVLRILVRRLVDGKTEPELYRTESFDAALKQLEALDLPFRYGISELASISRALIEADEPRAIVTSQPEPSKSVRIGQRRGKPTAA